MLLWHMEKAIHGRSKPVKLKGEHRSNIFCLAFDSSNTKVFSGGEFQTNAADLSQCLRESVTKMCCGLMGNVRVNDLTHQPHQPRLWFVCNDVLICPMCFSNFH